MYENIYTNCLGNNTTFSVVITENRNKNILKIHDNNMGMKIYENSNIYDSDVLKILRYLNSVEYDLSITTNEIIQKLNKVCRHLKINLITNEIIL